MKDPTLGGFLMRAGVWVESFNKFAHDYGLRTYAKVDHICYKCGSRESFVAMRTMFESLGCHFTNAPVSGRSIAYIRLNAPIKTYLGDLWYLELSDQKPDSTQEDGFDHIEVYPLARTFDHLVEHLVGRGVHLVESGRRHHPTHDVDIGHGFELRCERGPLIEKIKEEMG